LLHLLRSPIGPSLPTRAVQQVGSYLGHTGHQNQCSRHGSP
jgi:hypothetical protein